MFLFSIITSEDPLSVRYFEPSIKKQGLQCLNEMVFDVYLEDLKEKIEQPQLIHRGRRTFYLFE